MSTTDGEVPIDSETDIVSVRQAVRAAAAAAGYRATDVTRIVTVASELARNVYAHAGTGRMMWARRVVDGRGVFELRFDDEGPGIADVAQATREGFSTNGGLGLGLSGAQRLMGHLEITSEPGRGTTVVTRKPLPAGSST